MPVKSDTTKRRILITGLSGQVGEALTRTLAPLGELFAPSQDEFDLCNAGAIRQVMSDFRPSWVVNAAAHTAVDKAESESALAFAINAAAVEILAEESRRIGSVMIHYSTDYVFDGSKQTPYVESDPVGPLNVYGSSKLAGEQALAASGIPHFVFRTSWVYGARGQNFLLTILRLAREREHLRIVGDQRGAPTWSFDLARMTAHVIGHCEESAAQSQSPLAEAVLPISGLYHASGMGETTWYGFAAQIIAELQAMEPEARLATVEAISTAEYPTPAKRPRNSLLDCSKLDRVFQWRMQHWRDSLSGVLAEIAR